MVIVESVFDNVKAFPKWKATNIMAHENGGDW
jgi:hypothetical protein